METLLKKDDLLRPSALGEIVEGKIIAVGRSSIFVDLGRIGTGVIYGKELYEVKSDLKDLKIGDKIFAKITNFDNEEGYVELSLKEASQEINWTMLDQKKEKKEVQTVKILRANKGGLITTISNIPAFLPVSQLSFQNYPRVEKGDKSKILRALQQLVGKTLRVKIITVTPKKELLIISERVALLSEMQEMLKNYKIGDVVEGEVTGIVDFGVFLRFPLSKKSNKQIEGLIHISELDWQLIEDPSKIVRLGEKLKAKIIEISDDKVSLSLKALKKNPWEDIEKKYKKGNEVLGEVAKFNPFGAFIKISSKIFGLCHVSEFGIRSKMEKVLEIGKKYKFKILEIEPKEHKMLLKLVK